MVRYRNRRFHGNILYKILSVIETLFVFRLIFKFFEANPGNIFVSIIYTITETLQAPFTGVLRVIMNNGIETKSVFEPITIVAMIAYAIIAYIIARLINITK